MAATWQRSIEAFYGCGGVGKGRGARGLHQTLDSLARSVCDRTVMQLPNQLIIMPYFNKETFISVLDGRKALRHQVFMYMDCKCQHFCDLSVILLLCFKSLVRLIFSFPPPPPLWKQTKHTLNTCLSVGLFHVVMLYLLLCSSHVAGMIGLINKTKGLRFCNVSGFLELYNDPQVRLTAINSQSCHSKYP